MWETQKSNLNHHVGEKVLFSCWPEVAIQYSQQQQRCSSLILSSGNCAAAFLEQMKLFIDRLRKDAREHMEFLWQKWTKQNSSRHDSGFVHLLSSRFRLRPSPLVTIQAWSNSVRPTVSLLEQKIFAWKTKIFTDNQPKVTLAADWRTNRRRQFRGYEPNDVKINCQNVPARIPARG